MSPTRTEPASFRQFGTTLTGNGAVLLDLDAVLVEELLASYGFVLLRGHRDGVGEFEAFTDRFGEVRPANLRTRSPRPFETGRGTQSVMPGHDRVPLHAESYFTPICPDVLAFGCVENTADGGRSVLCDGRALLACLTAEDRGVLERTSILWEHCAPVGEIEAQTQRSVTDFVEACRLRPSCTVTVQDGEVHLRYSAPAVRHTRFPGEPALANNLIPIWAAGLLQSACPGLPTEVVQRMADQAEAMCVLHEWEPGDVVLIDNTRVMHGRTAFRSGTRKILVRMLAVAA